MDNTNTSRVFTKVTVLVFLIGIVVGFGSASLWLRRSKSADVSVQSGTSENTSAVSETTPTPESNNSAAEKPANTSLGAVSAALSGAKNSLSVNDQTAGNMVSVSSAVLESAAWVAIHEDNAGKPGKILGAQMFPSGTHSGAVDLLRATTAGGVYYAMLHADDGDHAFDAAKDMPVKDAGGNPVMVKFVATGAGINSQ